MQWTHKSINNLEKKGNKVGGLPFPDFKTYYKATVTKTVCYQLMSTDDMCLTHHIHELVGCSCELRKSLTSQSADSQHIRQDDSMGERKMFSTNGAKTARYPEAK